MIEKRLWVPIAIAAVVIMIVSCVIGGVLGYVLHGKPVEGEPPQGLVIDIRMFFTILLGIYIAGVFSAMWLRRLEGVPK